MNFVIEIDKNPDTVIAFYSRKTELSKKWTKIFKGKFLLYRPIYLKKKKQY